jgi:predicted phage baseplate assembly protein
VSTIATPVCPCDAAGSTPITNLPGLPQIAYRTGDFNDFRRALLTPLLPPLGDPPLEQFLTAWRSSVGSDPSVIDLAVMMVEWWAYLADILTFYNERIANEDYLRTAALPETPAALIQLLGYRPRPAIGATGTLAALVTPSVLEGQTVTLPKGLQFQSKPGPGGAPQTFELAAATSIGLPDRVPSLPPPVLVASLGSGVSGILLRGSVTSVSTGTQLLLGARDDTAKPALITLTAPPALQTAANGRKQTLLSFTGTPPTGLTAENARLTRANQKASLWTVNGNAIDGAQIQLAGLARQIRPNDLVLFTSPGQTSQLVQVLAVTDVLGDASTDGSATTVSPGPPGKAVPIPILHTQLTLESDLSSGLTGGQSGIVVSSGSQIITTKLAKRTKQQVAEELAQIAKLNLAEAAVSVLFDWVEVGTLIDQPPARWNGVSGNLQAIQPAQFKSGGSASLLLQDSAGSGQLASGTAGGAGLSVNWPATTATPLSPGLQPPINVLYNLLPVTRGKTVANEILGSGDGTVAGQSFVLAKSPVTYLSSGPSYASTIALTVNGQPWTEVATFYGQLPDAQVFVTREDAAQKTHIDFGDGVNGSRLPTGNNNVVATYRVEAGADSPPAGKLTVIAQSYPGLQSVLNPVAVSGGSDPDPASLLRQYAPRSVLTFGRAVSVFDYQALAAQAPGVTMAAATWSWDAANQRAAVTVYVAGEANVAASVGTLLAAAGDPNRPVTVLQAQPVAVTLTMTLIVTVGMDQSAIQAGVTAALCDPRSGIFSPPQTGIGQGLFDSAIEAACLTVSGVIAIKTSQFSMNGAVDAGPLHYAGEGAYFALDPANFNPTTEPASND